MIVLMLDRAEDPPTLRHFLWVVPTPCARDVNGIDVHRPLRRCSRINTLAQAGTRCPFGGLVLFSTTARGCSRSRVARTPQLSCRTLAWRRRVRADAAADGPMRFLRHTVSH